MATWKSKEDACVFLLKPRVKSTSFAASQITKVLNFNPTWGKLNLIDPKAEKESMNFLSNIITEKRLIACRDIAKGGLITSLLKMTSLEKEIHFISPLQELEEFLFSERAGSYLLMASEANASYLCENINNLKNNELIKIANVCSHEAKIIIPGKKTINLRELNTID